MVSERVTFLLSFLLLGWGCGESVSEAYFPASLTLGSAHLLSNTLLSTLSGKVCPHLLILSVSSFLLVPAGLHVFACSDETVQETNSYPTLEKCLFFYFCTFVFDFLFFFISYNSKTPVVQ